MVGPNFGLGLGPGLDNRGQWNTEVTPERTRNRYLHKRLFCQCKVSQQNMCIYRELPVARNIKTMHYCECVQCSV